MLIKRVMRSDAFANGLMQRRNQLQPDGDLVTSVMSLKMSVLLLLLHSFRGEMNRKRKIQNKYGCADFHRTFYPTTLLYNNDKTLQATPIIIKTITP